MENIARAKEEIVAIVITTRLDLYNHGLQCGANAILRKMTEYHVEPLPSERTISRILVRQGLTHNRTGRYHGDS